MGGPPDTVPVGVPEVWTQSNSRCADVGRGLPRPWRSADCITAETTRMWLRLSPWGARCKSTSCFNARRRPSLYPFMERLHEQECVWCPRGPGAQWEHQQGGMASSGWAALPSHCRFSGQLSSLHCPALLYARLTAKIALVLSSSS